MYYQQEACSASGAAICQPGKPIRRRKEKYENTHQPILGRRWCHLGCFFLFVFSLE
jgi:hypothetical protein